MGQRKRHNHSRRFVGSARTAAPLRRSPLAERRAGFRGGGVAAAGLMSEPPSLGALPTAGRHWGLNDVLWEPRTLARRRLSLVTLSQPRRRRLRRRRKFGSCRTIVRLRAVGQCASRVPGCNDAPFARAGRYAGSEGGRQRLRGRRRRVWGAARPATTRAAAACARGAAGRERQHVRRCAYRAASRCPRASEHTSRSSFHARLSCPLAAPRFRARSGRGAVAAQGRAWRAAVPGAPPNRARVTPPSAVVPTEVHTLTGVLHLYAPVAAGVRLQSGAAAAP